MNRSLPLICLWTCAVLISSCQEDEPAGCPSSISAAFDLAWGSTGSDPGFFNYPTSCAVNAVGEVYVVDQGNNRIQKFSGDGVFLMAWGDSGSADGLFVGPEDIAIDTDGNVYVADTGNSRVQKFDSNGTWLAAWGTQGTLHGQFEILQGITVDGDGNVYAMDLNNSHIQKFDADGTFVSRWGTHGYENGKLFFPLDIVVDSNQNIVVIDQAGYGRIQKFDNKGALLSVIKLYANGRGIGINACDEIFITEFNENEVILVHPDGTVMMEWGSQGAGEGEFFNPSSVADAANGAFYVVDTGNNRILKFSPDVAGR